MEPGLDHLVYAVPDLARGVADVAGRTGMQPVPGGSHADRGTANYLLGLGGAAYLEIIGPDPEQPDHDGPRPFGVTSATVPGLVTWAARCDDIDATVARARAGGYDPGAVEDMSRRTPDGDLLQWRLTPGAPGLVPFLIDWGATVHPTARELPVVPLLSFRARGPYPEQVRAALTALGVDLVVEPGERPALIAVLEGRSGRVEL